MKFVRRHFLNLAAGAAVLLAFLVSALPVLAQELPPTQERPPTWAYPVAPKDYVPPADDGTVRHLPGSTKGYTLTDIRNLFFALDWFPEGHAPMPPLSLRAGSQI